MDENGTIYPLPPNPTTAWEVDLVFYFIFYSSLVLLALLMITAAYFVFKYLRRGEGEITSGLAHRNNLQIAWTVIPSVLVFIVFIWCLKIFLKMNVIPEEALEIKATGQKWLWAFEYPNGAINISDLVVPVGHTIKLFLSSQDVVHRFFVPDFGVKMDVLPDHHTVTWFEATKTGNFEIYGIKSYGEGQSEMLGYVIVLTEKEYNVWLSKSSIDIPEGMSLEEAGAQLYRSKTCIFCHSIDGRPGVAPSFKGRFGTQQSMADGHKIMIDEHYLRESILYPQAKVVAGFQPVMMTYQKILKDRQIDALIAYIKSLQD